MATPDCPDYANCRSKNCDNCFNQSEFSPINPAKPCQRTLAQRAERKAERKAQRQTDAAKQARRSRRKGKRGEDEVVALVKPVWPNAARDPTSGAQSGTDITGIESHGVRLRLESKCRASVPKTVYGYLKIPEGHGVNVPPPRVVDMVMMRRNNMPWVIAMSWDMFKFLMQGGQK